MDDRAVDVWLYGALACYGAEASQGSFAHLEMVLPAGATMADLLARLALPADARGITFINGQLSAMPGLQPDLGHVLAAGDRVAFFDQRSMWPYQYRSGAALAQELAVALGEQGPQHSYRQAEPRDAAG